jgi:hypothetical protein
MATQAFYYSNTAVAGTIGNTGGISNSGLSLYLTSTPSGYPSSFPFKLTLGGLEVVYVASGAGTSGSPWVLSARGQEGTTAQSWPQTTTSVQHQATAGDFTTASLHEGSVAADLPHGLPAGAWLTAAMATIVETTFASSGGAFTWSSIPATYKHLILICQARLTETTLQSDDIGVQLNGSAAAVYSYLTISGTNISGATTGALTQAAATGFAVTSWPMFRVAASESGAAVNAGGGLALIPNYTSTAFNTMFVGLSGMGDGTSAAVDGRMRWGWFNPASQTAITSITITPPSGNFLTGSFFGLYGLS